MNKMFVGTPIIPPYLYEHGIEAVLDEMRESAAINNILVFTHTAVGRQYLPGFAKQKAPSEDRNITDVFVRHSEDAFPDTPLRFEEQPDDLYADRDILDELLEAAAPRDMSVWGRILEPYRITGALIGAENCAEVDAEGNATDRICFTHPDYLAFWDTLLTDLVKRHPGMSGFKYGQERAGPLCTTLQGGAAPCFCERCVKQAESRGIRTAEAREGFKALAHFRDTHLRDLEGDPAENRPLEGYWNEYQRILMQHPDMFSWDRMWMDNREEQRKRMYKLLKSINPELQVGWHIDHGMSWDPITRSLWPYADMAPHSDWLSLGLYFDSLGRRSTNHFRNVYARLLFADTDPETAHRFYLSILGYDPEREPDYRTQDAQSTAFTADYVYRETLRAVKSLKGTPTQVYSRVGFDMPPGMTDIEHIPSKEVYDAVTAALKAGAHGLFCGREWKELTPKNRQAFGDAVRDWTNESAPRCH